MKKIYSGLFMLGIFIHLAVLVNAQGTTITLLHVNDSHSHLDAIGPKDAQLNGTLGGLAKAATYIGTTKLTDPNVLVLHAGDAFTGDPLFNVYFGVPEFQLMKQIGFDAMTIGNHEFDFGPTVLNGVLTTAFAGGSFPLLSANLDMSGYPALQSFIQPSIIKTYGGVKVGIFGLTVPGNPMNNPSPVIISSDIFNIAQATAAQLRANGADAVICLSHLGYYYDQLVAANTYGIDFFIGGHDHYVFTQPKTVTNAIGGTVYLCQAGAHYKNIGKMHFTINAGTVTLNDYRMVEMDKNVPKEPTVQATVEYLKQGVVAKYGDIYHSVSGVTFREIDETYNTGNPLRDTPLGNLATDAFKQKGMTDIAITPLGLIAEPIYRGIIVPADIFRSFSYGYDPPTGLGFQLATFNLTGMELIKGMEIGLSQLEVGDDFFLQYSGVRFRYDPSMPVGQRVILNSIFINGRRINPNATYSCTMNTGVLALLGMLGVNVTNIQVLPDFEYNVVKDFISHRGLVIYTSQGRIIEKQNTGTRQLAEANAPVPVTEPRLYENYPNPFSGITYFEFDIPVESAVTLKIYDVVGNEIATVANGTYGNGSYKVQWDGCNAPPGIYLSRLTIGSYSETKRLMITR